MWLDRAGKTLEVLGEPDGYWYFRLSPDGKHFVTSRGYGRPPTDLWLMTVERHVFSLFAPPARATSVYRSPVWSNDGRTVLFSKGGTVFRKDVTASGEGDRVAEWPGLNRLCDWSRDGRLLLYESLPDPETKRDLWVAEVTPDGRPVEGTQPKPYVRGPFAEWQGRFSPEPNPRWAA